MKTSEMQKEKLLPASSRRLIFVCFLLETTNFCSIFFTSKKIQNFLNWTTVKIPSVVAIADDTNFRLRFRSIGLMETWKTFFSSLSDIHESIISGPIIYYSELTEKGKKKKLSLLIFLSSSCFVRTFLQFFYFVFFFFFAIIFSLTFFVLLSTQFKFIYSLSVFVFISFYFLHRWQNENFYP